jgi:transcription-repair coupling factor (superfamily II helicase)
VNIVPARERQQHVAGDTIVDYLTEKALLIIDDLDELKTVVDKLHSEAEEVEAKSEPAGSSELPVLSWSAFRTKINTIEKRLMLFPWNTNYSDRVGLQSLPLTPVPGYGGRLEAFSEGLKGMLHEKQRIVVVSQQTNRLAELLQEQDIMAGSVSQIEQVPPMKSITLVHGSLAEGWAIKDVLIILTDNDIFGFVKKRRLSGKRPVRYHLFVPELKPGDFVVHI